MKIGFVGLGPMGTPMAGRLLAAGHSLAVFNRTQARADDLVARGARRAGSPAEAARDADIVFSMLANDAVVESLSFGEAGILAGLPKDAVHVSTSTISPDLSTRLQRAHDQRGQLYAAATVLGRPPAAEAGELFIVLAGAETARSKISGPLAALGQRVFDIGEDPAQANLVKLSLNFMIFSTIEQMSEMFALNDKGGIAPATLFEIMTSSFFTAPVHKNYGRIIVEQRFEPPGAAVPLALKDNRLLLEAAADLAVPLPMASLLRDRFLAMTAKGEAGLDFAALSRRSRDDGGLPF
ncbi:NAD(P)-dependent oxidoreductase [Lichenicoccus sp.]|uniref:NAD(P)-dependent oxidoreductase n=1 Tax=Lichenicoccus sp. TaxID=2781899 RepID=UPI003D0E6DF8